jgi:hypothetical protein
MFVPWPTDKDGKKQIFGIRKVFVAVMDLNSGVPTVTTGTDIEVQELQDPLNMRIVDLSVKLNGK